MSDHTWRHRHINVQNKKRVQEGKEPFPKYKGKGWDQKSQDDGSWKPSDVDYEQVEKDLGKEGQLTWPKPKIHPDDVAPEDKYKQGNVLQSIWGVTKALLPDPGNPNEIAEFFVDMASDAKAFGKGAAGGAAAGALVDGPLPFGEAIGGIIGGTAGVITRRTGKELLKPLFTKGEAYIDNLLQGVFKPQRFATANGADSFYQVARNSDELSNVSKIDGDIPTQRDITPNITMANQKALKKMGLWEYFREFDVSELDSKGLTRRRASAIVSPENRGFSKATAERLGKLPELRSFYENLTDMEILAELDHMNPLKLTAYLMDKTTGAKRVDIRKILLEEGINYGDMIENMQALPREVHKIWTDNMNRVMGKQLDTFLAEMTTLGITKPDDIAREYAKRIKDAREHFDVAFDAHKITYGSKWTDNIDDMVDKLDEAYELGDDWSPTRSLQAKQSINQTISNLDEFPLSNLPAGNAGLQQVVESLGLDKLTDVDIELFSKLSLPEQMSQLQKRSGMTLGDIETVLATSNIDLKSILDLIE